MAVSLSLTLSTGTLPNLDIAEIIVRCDLDMVEYAPARSGIGQRQQILRSYSSQNSESFYITDHVAQVRHEQGTLSLPAHRDKNRRPGP